MAQEEEGIETLSSRGCIHGIRISISPFKALNSLDRKYEISR